MDLIIQSDRIITENGCVNGKIAIKNEKIVGLFSSDIELDTKNIIDARGKVVLPGAIDTHVHLRFPSHPDWEDIVSGTSAAAAGGFTTIFEMPIADKGVHTAEILKERIDIANQKSIIDVALYGGGGHGSGKNIKSMAEHGAVAFKIFLYDGADPGRDKNFYGITQTNYGELFWDLYTLKESGRVTCFHAESEPILEYAKKQLNNTNLNPETAHSKAHPIIAELDAISRVILFSEHTGAPVSIVHVSSPEGAQLIKEAKKRGVRIYAETCPHYLFASENDLNKIGAYAKINPPLRSEERRARMWEYILDGTIDYIGTDHAPFSSKEKEKGKNNILNAPSGIPGLETQFPLLLTAASQGYISYKRIAELTSQNQARIFGIDKQKGSISIGKDADFTIVDPNVSWQIDHTKMKTKARDIALLWDGKQVKGCIDKTILRGTVVYQNQKIQVSPGYGNIVVPI